MSAGIGLGDLLRAWDATGREPAAIASLAQLLALGAPGPGPDGAGEAAVAAARAAAAAKAAARAAAAAAAAAAAPAPSAPEPARATAAEPGLASTSEAAAPGAGADEGPAAQLRIAELPSIAPDLPVWWTQGEGLAAPAPAPRAPPDPLFAPQRERALLAAASRMLRPEGDLDIDQIIEGYARHAPPRELPRRKIPSHAGGCQLIVDGSRWMAPFADDLAALSARLALVAGGAFAELIVPGLPPEVLGLDDDDPAPWRAPPAGTAIVVVTDVGRAARRRGDPGPAARWEAFLRSIVVAGFAPVVIVPGRCAAEVCTLRNAKVIDWDRETRVSEVAQFRKARAR